MPQEFEAGALTPEAARIIREEHARLGSLLRQIETTSDLGALLPLMEKLRELLVPHFEHEETPDALGIAVHEPRLERRVEELFEEHRAFLDQLDELLRRGRACLEGPDTVVREITELAHRLHEHEAKENELMIDLADTDLGGRG